MKRLLIIIFGLGILIAPTTAQGIYKPVVPTTSRNLNKIILDDGIYELPVQYVSNTSYNTSYKLKVKIQNDNIVCIYFDNGGYLHSGYNNSGYSWSGGGIRWNTDWNGNIISGKAIIQIDYNDNRWQLFTISL